MALINHALWIWNGAFSGKADLRHVPDGMPDNVPGQQKLYYRIRLGG